MWTYEKDELPRVRLDPRATNYKTFNLPHYRAILLRGIAWAGKRANLDEFCSRRNSPACVIPKAARTAPEKAAAKLEVHPDFTLKLVAAEPLINKADELRLGPGGPAVGRGNARVSERPPRHAPG